MILLVASGSYPQAFDVFAESAETGLEAWSVELHVTESNISQTLDRGVWCVL